MTPKYKLRMLRIAFWGVGQRDLDLPCGHAAQSYHYVHNEYAYHTNSMQRSRGESLEA